MYIRLHTEGFTIRLQCKSLFSYTYLRSAQLYEKFAGVDTSSGFLRSCVMKRNETYDCWITKHHIKFAGPSYRLLAMGNTYSIDQATRWGPCGGPLVWPPTYIATRVK
jgi:hypothetical protein